MPPIRVTAIRPAGRRATGRETCRRSHPVRRLASGIAAAAPAAIFIRSAHVASNLFRFPRGSDSPGRRARGGGFEAERALASPAQRPGTVRRGNVIFRELADQARTDEQVDAARGRATSLGGAGRLAEAESMYAAGRSTRSVGPQARHDALRRPPRATAWRAPSAASGRSSRTNRLISTVAWKRPRGWRVCGAGGRSDRH